MIHRCCRAGSPTGYPFGTVLSVLPIRRVVERSSRHIRFRRRLPKEVGGGPIVVSPDSALQFLDPTRRPFRQLTGWANEFVRPDMTIWDVGANVGVFALSAAALLRSGSVLAIEPDPYLVDTLSRSLQLPANRELPVTVLSAAVSHEAGIAGLNVAERGRSSNFLDHAKGRSQSGGWRSQIQVPTLTMDHLLAEFGTPDLIKVDVEGAEVSVLAGAGQLLEARHSTWIIEVGSDVAQTVYREFNLRGYSIFDADVPSGRRVPLDTCAYNSLMVPAR